MFNSVFRKVPSSISTHALEENVEDSEDHGEEDDNRRNMRMGSPGMEHLIEEEQAANRRLKKNEKFNKAFDIAKVAAEYTSRYGQSSFETHLDTFRKFTELIRTGLPDEVIEIIKKYSERNDETAPTLDNENIRPSEADPQPREVNTMFSEDDSSGGVGNLGVEVNQFTQSSSSTPVSDRCRKIDIQNKNYIQDNCVVYKIPGDGSCLFGACAAAIYQDENQGHHLRRLTNYFIVEHFWYFQEFIPFPFVENVGVGERRQLFSFYSVEHLQNFLSAPRPHCYTIECHTVDVLHFFLQSEESQKCWSNSQV